MIDTVVNTIATVILIALGFMYLVHLNDVKAIYRFPRKVVQVSMSVYMFVVVIALYALWRS